jgi:ligand-binding SRPBCC domain-containing protein
MRMRLFVWRSGVPVSARDLFAWHERPMAFERLTPAWEKVKVREQTGGIRDGARVVLQVPFGPVSTEWEVRHEAYVADRQFVDRQVRGPFAFWKHSHLVEAAGENKSFLEDRIEYALPFGAVGDFFGGGMVRRKLERLFRYRHAVTVDDLAAFDQYRSTRAMKVLISGSTG